VTPCIRCGYCCRVATCAVGVARGSDPRRCAFLRGTPPGEHSCALVEQGDPAIVGGAAIGGGCSSTIGNTVRRDRLRARQDRAESVGDRTK
jgi:hypothetical protein